MSIFKKNLDTTNMVIFQDKNYHLQLPYITVLELKAIELLDYIDVCEISK